MPRSMDLSAYWRERPRGSLLVLSPPNPSPGLERALCEARVAWDQATCPGEARQLFFLRGGHDALLVAPGTPAGLARQVTWSLRAMDPSLLVLSFLDIAALGPLKPAGIPLVDLDLSQAVGRKTLRRRLRFPGRAS